MAFNLADVLKDVPKLGTEREQIEYISLDLIESDPNNFYQLSDIENLAANIALCGLQQPIRVRPISGADNYRIVSGHRRRAALEELRKDDPERWSEVPCIVEQDEASPALQQLRLIYANANTRTMTSAELSEQAVQVEKLLYQLKEDGYEFPGRMRDHVAQAVGQSKSKLARLKVIRDNLADCFVSAYKDSTLNESVAYSLAQLNKDDQILLFEDLKNKDRKVSWLDAKDVDTFKQRIAFIENLRCDKLSGKCACNHIAEKKIVAASTERYIACHCTQCCSDCPALVSCKSACPVMSDKIAKLKADKREAAALEKSKREERERPYVQKISDLWQRFGLARELAYKDWDDCKRAMGLGYFSIDNEKVMKLECGEQKITPETKLPYGSSCYLTDVEQIVAVADLLGCSLDYLLCRTDVREVATQTQNVPNLNTFPGCSWHPASQEPPVGIKVIIVDHFGFCDDCVYLGGGQWSGRIDEGEPIYAWSMIPTDDDLSSATQSAASGNGWQTGNPVEYGTYVACIQLSENTPKRVRELVWTGDEWLLYGEKLADGVTVRSWIRPPEESV